MRIVDVCAFYSPFGGGVRTYVDHKLRAASALGHEIVVIVPGERDSVIHKGRGAFLATIASPALPLDARYRYFNDEPRLHRELDRWKPDHLEASSPWSSASMVARWTGHCTRSLVLHSDPLSSYAYRWFGGVASRAAIDRMFGRDWDHLRVSKVCAHSVQGTRLRHACRGKQRLPRTLDRRRSRQSHNDRLRS